MRILLAFVGILLAAYTNGQVLKSDSTKSSAQGAEETVKFSNLHFYAAGLIAVPSREFREAIDNSFGNLGYGFSSGVLISPHGEKKPSPALLGIDFGYFNYGIDKIEATSTTPALKTSHNVFTWNGTIRFRPAIYQGAITPFVDGMMGVKVFNTKTKIDKNLLHIVLNDNQPEVINNVKDTGFNYGLGAGFITNSKTANYAGFSLRVLYLWGDHVKYVVRNSVKVDANRNVTFESAEAKSTMVVIQLGFTASNVRKIVKGVY